MTPTNPGPTDAQLAEWQRVAEVARDRLGADDLLAEVVPVLLAALRASREECEALRNRLGRGIRTVTTQSFPEIHIFRQRRGKCVECGRLTNHRVKAWQTVSPFNKSASGIPKAADEIREELRAELERKASVPLKCATCDPNRGKP